MAGVTGYEEIFINNGELDFFRSFFPFIFSVATFLVALSVARSMLFKGSSLLPVLGFVLSSVNAAPAPVGLSKRASITALTAAQIAAFKPFTFFAASAYCTPAQTLAWSCGFNCAGNADFIPTASGGDGSSVQFWYVGYSPSQASVIVGHQGTDLSKIEADATDLNAFLTNLDSTLFPGLNSSIKVHNGFASEQAKTATAVLAAVKSTLACKKATIVTVVGHSLGGAIAQIDGAYLDLQLPSNITIKVITYGMPRVGNQEWANYIDANAPLTHINNKEDLVPIVPGRSLGYHHPSGEIHITDSGAWLSCPGQDNTDSQCSTGDVTNILVGSTVDHDGPYDGGITFGTGVGCS